MAISTGAAVAAFVAAIVSAVYWYRSSRIDVPETAGVGFGGPANLKPMADALRQAALLNKMGAIWAAVAAALAALGSVTSAMGS